MKYENVEKIKEIKNKKLEANLMRAKLFVESETFQEYQFEKCIRQCNISNFLDVFFYKYIYENYFKLYWPIFLTLYIIGVLSSVIYSTINITPTLCCITILSTSSLAILIYIIYGFILDRANDYIYMNESNSILEKYSVK